MKIANKCGSCLYDKVRKVFNLPCRKTVFNHTLNTQNEPDGIMDAVLRQMHMKEGHKKEQDRCVCLGFDSMVMLQSITFNGSSFNIEGIDDNESASLMLYP